MLEKLKKSPINYFSDLFIVTMVLAWIIEIIVMNVMGIYSTIVIGDVYIWSEVQVLVTAPLTAGGAIWMIKNSVQHAIANHNGQRAYEDFPEVEGAQLTTENVEGGVE